MMIELIADSIRRFQTSQNPVRLWITRSGGINRLEYSGLDVTSIEMIRSAPNIALLLALEAEACANETFRYEQKEMIDQMESNLDPFDYWVLAILNAYRIPKELVSKFRQRFVNPAKAFYEQNSDGSYRAIYSPLNEIEIMRHFEGRQTIGFPSIASDGTCRWICFDDDSFLPPEQAGRLERIQQYLEEKGYHSIREGKRYVENGLCKQGHLWILFDKPISAALARKWANALPKEVGLEDLRDFEIFPKQDNPEKAGNCVRGPLGFHAKGKKRGRFRDAPWPVPDQLEWFNSQPLNSTEEILRIGNWQNELAKAQAKYQTNFTKVKPKNQGPTVLEMLEMLHADRLDKGDRWLYQCPLCKQEGHDTHKDNLHVSKENTWYGCFYGGWSDKHKPKMIYKSLLDLTQQRKLHDT